MNERAEQLPLYLDSENRGDNIEEILRTDTNLVLLSMVGGPRYDLTSVIQIGQPVFIDTITEGIGDFPMMLRTITTIKIINIIKNSVVQRYKKIYRVMKFNSYRFHSCHYYPVRHSNRLNYNCVIISVTYRKIKPQGKFIVNIQIDSAAGAMLLSFINPPGWIVEPHL